MFPPIDRPCPYVDRLDSVMDGDFCRMCRRTVFDLTAMDEAERRAFLAGCASDDEVCVRYLRPALAAAALAASVAALPAAAQQAPGQTPTPQPLPANAVASEDEEVAIVTAGRVGPSVWADPHATSLPPITVQKVWTTRRDDRDRRKPAPHKD
ncbi:hypothetical protein [Sphingomonas sp.]|uniref:hypothetical protein n=1 Tax=Sphingomonas sp. TaxID=28214 RepID=UPI001B2DD105|nr:hypothetical protein [Sphingomonas sp.]MBO9713151.1 hypothetical protein [Sphingomonas sp.]